MRGVIVAQLPRRIITPAPDGARSDRTRTMKCDRNGGHILERGIIGLAHQYRCCVIIYTAHIVAAGFAVDIPPPTPDLFFDEGTTMVFTNGYRCHAFEGFSVSTLHDHRRIRRIRRLVSELLGGTISPTIRIAPHHCTRMCKTGRH